jgi:hypothetical protein
VDRNKEKIGKRTVKKIMKKREHNETKRRKRRERNKKKKKDRKKETAVRFRSYPRRKCVNVS